MSFLGGGGVGGVLLKFAILVFVVVTMPYKLTVLKLSSLKTWLQLLLTFVIWGKLTTVGFHFSILKMEILFLHELLLYPLNEVICKRELLAVNKY